MVVFKSHVESQKDILVANPEKVRVVKEWLVPVDGNYLRAFLGTAGYYVQIVSLLYRPLQKRNRFKRTVECERVFLDLSANCRMPQFLLASSWGNRSYWTVMPVKVRGGVVWVQCEMNL